MTHGQGGRQHVGGAGRLDFHLSPRGSLGGLLAVDERDCTPCRLLHGWPLAQRTEWLRLGEAAVKDAACVVWRFRLLFNQRLLARAEAEFGRLVCWGLGSDGRRLGVGPLSPGRLSQCVLTYCHTPLPCPVVGGPLCSLCTLWPVGSIIHNSPQRRAFIPLLRWRFT